MRNDPADGWIREECLRLLLDSTAEGIFGLDLSGACTFCNQSAARMLGYASPADVRGALAHPLLHHTRPDGSPHPLQECSISRAFQDGQESYVDDDVFWRADGTSFPVEYWSRPIRQGARTVGAVVTFLDITQRRDNEAAAEECEARFQRLFEASLATRLMRAQDAERRRIARELHETTAQGLAALKMNLAALGRQAATMAQQTRALVAESVALAEQAMGEIRTLSYLLHPPLLDEVGLASALRWYVSGFARRSGVAVELSVSDELGRFSAELEMALFRVVQESLINIHRHAHSPTARISIRREMERVVLEVHDQGRGMVAHWRRAARRVGRDPREPLMGAGVGIAAMRERIAQLGGQLEIASTAGGTTVRAVLPSSTEVNRDAANTGG